jgi:hypothetical protein
MSAYDGFIKYVVERMGIDYQTVHNELKDYRKEIEEIINSGFSLEDKVECTYPIYDMLLQEYCDLFKNNK